MPRVGRRAQVRLDAPADEVRDVVARALAERPDGGPIVEATVEPDGPDRSVVVLEAAWHVDLPYFGWFVRLLAAASARGVLRDAVARVHAAVRKSPPRGGPRWLACL